MQHLGLNNDSGYNVTEVFDDNYIGVFKPHNALVVRVNPSGVFFGKAIALGSWAVLEIQKTMGWGKLGWTWFPEILTKKGWEPQKMYSAEKPLLLAEILSLGD